MIPCAANFVFDTVIEESSCSRSSIFSIDVINGVLCVAGTVVATEINKKIMPNTPIPILNFFIVITPYIYINKDVFKYCFVKDKHGYKSINIRYEDEVQRLCQTFHSMRKKAWCRLHIYPISLDISWGFPHQNHLKIHPKQLDNC